jgi:conjugal transfer pilus assembly protein TraB
MSENLSPKAIRKRQIMVLAGLAAAGFAVYLLTSYLSGPPAEKNRPTKPEKLVQAPGQVDERAIWRGQAEGDLRAMRDSQKALEARLAALEDKQKKPDATGANANGLTTPPPEPQKAEAKEPKPGEDKQYTDKEKGKLKDIRAKDKQDVPPSAERGNFRYPPGNPSDPQAAAPVPQPRRLEFVDVSTKGAGDPPPATGDKAGTAKSAAPRKTVDNYLSIGHIPIVILGGLNAPTGGQSQNNSLPIYFRVREDGYLANGFRSRVKECLGVGTGYGDLSAERAILRTETLSCVLKDGTIVEATIKGTIFGDDGMAGIHGKVVTKTGQMLGNAALAGVSSGIGHAFQQSSMTQSISPLGTTSTVDTGKQFQAGIGTGVGNALDKLAQYWIRLADKTFPVVEVQGGVYADLVIQKGAYIDLPPSGDDGLSELEKRNRRMNRHAED